MKTEPIGAMRERIKKLFEITAEDVTAIEANARRNEIIALAAFKKGQSSPKIKQLEWKVAEGTETILANIPFNNYYLIDGVDSMIFLTINSQFHIGRYATIEEAKAAAQKDFEERIEKCIAK